MTFVFTWGLVGGRVCAKWTRPLSHAFEVHLQNVCRWSLSRVFFLRELVEDGPTPLVGHRSYLECTHCFCNYIFTVNIYTWHTHTRIYIYIYLHIHYMHTYFWYVSFIFVRRDYYFVQRKICLEGSMSSKQNIGFQVYIHPKGRPTNLTPFSQGACLVKAVKGSHLPLVYFSTRLYKDTIINTCGPWRNHTFGKCGLAF